MSFSIYRDRGIPPTDICDLQRTPLPPDPAPVAACTLELPGGSTAGWGEVPHARAVSVHVLPEPLRTSTETGPLPTWLQTCLTHAGSVV